jgi:hypothetical protein
VTSLALTTAAPTVKSEVRAEDPTIKFPTVVVDPPVGNVRAGEKVVPVGSKVKVPAVLTLNALEVEPECIPPATIRMFPPVDGETGE